MSNAKTAIKIPAESINENLSVQCRVLVSPTHCCNAGELAGFDPEVAVRLMSLDQPRVEFCPAVRPYLKDGKPNPEAGLAELTKRYQTAQIERKAQQEARVRVALISGG
jgi:hypothetical protein